MANALDLLRRKLMRLALAILMLPVVLIATEPINYLSLPTNSVTPATPWKGLAGVVGGIRFRTTISETIATSASAATINTAIDNCASNSVVLLDPGTFSLNGGIDLDKSGVTLRGSTNSDGTPATILNFTASASPLIAISAGGVCGPCGGWFVGGAPGSYTDRTVSGVPTRGSTEITVTTTPTGLSDQQLMIFSCDNNSDVGGQGFTDFDTSLGANRPATFIVWVTNVSGTTIQFEPPFQPSHWSGTILVSYRTQADTVSYAGLENVKITRSSSAVDGNGLEFVGSRECWAYNVITDGSDASEYQTQHYMDYRSEWRRCQILRSYDYGSDCYGTRVIQSTGALLIDSVWDGQPNMVTLYGANLLVFYGNYITNCPYNPTNTLSQIVFYHGSHNSFNLFEHSSWPRSYHDSDDPGSWASAWNYNWVPGWDGNDSDGNKANDCLVLTWGTAVTVNYPHSRYSAVNNVLGKNGFHTVRIDTAAIVNDTLGIYRISIESSNANFYARNNYNYVDDAVPSTEAYTGGETATTSYFMTENELGHPRWPPFDPSDLSTLNPTNIQSGHRKIWVTNYVGASEGGGSPSISARVGAGKSVPRKPR